MKLLPFVLGLVLLGVRVGSAQVVRVRIVDADTHLPIVAARVTLRATRDSVGTTALTDDRGVFSVRASAQGPHLIEVVRLGYRPQRLGPIEVGARDSAPIEVALLAVPVALDSLTVTARANSRLLERRSEERRVGKEGRS